MISFYTQVLNLLGDIKKAIRFRLSNKYIKIPRHGQQRRWDICSQCEFLVHNKCSKCGCYMKLKTHIASASCPIDKWLAVGSEIMDDCDICPP